MSNFLKDILDVINEISSELNQEKNFQGNRPNRNPYAQKPYKQMSSPRPSPYKRPVGSGSKPRYTTPPRPQGNYEVGNINRPNWDLKGNYRFERTPVPQTGSNTTLKGSLEIEGSASLEGMPGVEGSAGSEGSLGIESDSSPKVSPVAKSSKVNSSKKSTGKTKYDEKSPFETALDFSSLTEEDVIRGIVFTEILGRPKALRRGR
jgi:hypothetical protein